MGPPAAPRSDETSAETWGYKESIALYCQPTYNNIKLYQLHYNLSTKLTEALRITAQTLRTPKT
jgi:hypothetical protein